MSDSFAIAWSAMQRRVRQRTDWLHSLPEGDPMRVLATLQNTAACYVTRKCQSDEIAMLNAIAAAKAIEEAAFAGWLAASCDDRPQGKDKEMKDARGSEEPSACRD